MAKARASLLGNEHRSNKRRGHQDEEARSDQGLPVVMCNGRCAQGDYWAGVVTIPAVAGQRCGCRELADDRSDDGPGLGHTHTHSAMHWLLFHKVAVMKVPGPSHRISNDCDQALADMGLKSLVSLVSLMLDTDQGPWGEGRWLETMREATLQYLKASDPDTCPIFNEYLQRIATDLDEAGEAHDMTWKQAAWELLGEVYKHTEARVRGTRWFDFVDKATPFIKRWHMKLVLLTCHMVTSGLFEKSPQVQLLQGRLGRPSNEVHPDAPQETRTTGRDNAWERDLKRRCGNQLQLQAVVMSDYDLYQLVRIITTSLEPSRLVHGLQSHGNGSVQEVQRWYSEKAYGKGIGHLNTTVGILRDPQKLEFIGMWLPGAERFIRALPQYIIRQSTCRPQTPPPSLRSGLVCPL